MRCRLPELRLRGSNDQPGANSPHPIHAPLNARPNSPPGLTSPWIALQVGKATIQLRPLGDGQWQGTGVGSHAVLEILGSLDTPGLLTGSPGTRNVEVAGDVLARVEVLVELAGLQAGAITTASTMAAAPNPASSMSSSCERPLTAIDPTTVPATTTGTPPPQPM